MPCSLLIHAFFAYPLDINPQYVVYCILSNHNMLWGELTFYGLSTGVKMCEQKLFEMMIWSMYCGCLLRRMR